MPSLLCLLFGSLNAKHNPFPSTMGLFTLSNKTFRVPFLIVATSSSAIGRLLLPINLRHGIDKVKSRNVFIACIRARCSSSDSSSHRSFIRMKNLFAIARRRSTIESRSKIQGKGMYSWFIRRLLENYCFVHLTNKAPPQISDTRPDMRQRALFVTSRAAWRWNKMFLARENVDSSLAAIVVSTEHNAL